MAGVLLCGFVFLVVGFTVAPICLSFYLNGEHKGKMFCLIERLENTDEVVICEVFKNARLYTAG